MGIAFVFPEDLVDRRVISRSGDGLLLSRYSSPVSSNASVVGSNGSGDVVGCWRAWEEFFCSACDDVIGYKIEKCNAAAQIYHPSSL